MNEPTSGTSKISQITANADKAETAESLPKPTPTPESIKTQSDDIYRKALKPDDILVRVKGQMDELAQKSKNEIDSLIISNELQLQVIQDAKVKIAENKILMEKHNGIISASNAFTDEAKKHG